MASRSETIEEQFKLRRAGNFQEGKRHGKGVYTRADGSTIVGTYKEGNEDKVKYYNKNNEEVTQEQYNSTAE